MTFLQHIEPEAGLAFWRDHSPSLSIGVVHTETHLCSEGPLKGRRIVDRGERQPFAAHGGKNFAKLPELLRRLGRQPWSANRIGAALLVAVPPNFSD
jgi:hypothetical protein